MIKISLPFQRHENDKPFIRWIYSTDYQRIFLNAHHVYYFITEEADGTISCNGIIIS